MTSFSYFTRSYSTALGHENWVKQAYGSEKCARIRFPFSRVGKAFAEKNKGLKVSENSFLPGLADLKEFLHKGNPSEMGSPEKWKTGAPVIFARHKLWGRQHFFEPFLPPLSYSQSDPVESDSINSAPFLHQGPRLHIQHGLEKRPRLAFSLLRQT